MPFDGAPHRVFLDEGEGTAGEQWASVAADARHFLLTLSWRCSCGEHLGGLACLGVEGIDKASQYTAFSVPGVVCKSNWEMVRWTQTLPSSLASQGQVLLPSMALCSQQTDRAWLTGKPPMLNSEKSQSVGLGWGTLMSR